MSRASKIDAVLGRLLGAPLAIALAVVAASCSSPNEQIECPAAEVGQGAGSLQETGAQMKSASDGLGRGSENEITEFAARARAQHPGATKDQIINYLITTYCPTINRKGSLDKTGKQQAMQSFAARAEKLVRPAR